MLAQVIAAHSRANQPKSSPFKALLIPFSRAVADWIISGVFFLFISLYYGIPALRAVANGGLYAPYSREVGKAGILITVYPLPELRIAGILFLVSLGFFGLAYWIFKRESK